MDIVQLEDPHLSLVDLTTALKTVFFCWCLLMLGSRLILQSPPHVADGFLYSTLNYKYKKVPYQEFQYNVMENKIFTFDWPTFNA